MSKTHLLVFAGACAECGKVHIEVWNADGTPIKTNNDAELVAALRFAAIQIERKKTTRVTLARHQTH